jgi:hypothetical protein
VAARLSRGMALAHVPEAVGEVRRRHLQPEVHRLKPRGRPPALEVLEKGRRPKYGRLAVDISINGNRVVSFWRNSLEDVV